MSNAQLVHALLENTRHEIRPLVSLKVSWKANERKKSAFTIVAALIFCIGIASGNIVLIIVSRYWLPDLDLGSGPTQSTNTLLNHSSIAGIGLKGAGLDIWFGFPSMERLAILHNIPF